MAPRLSVVFRKATFTSPNDSGNRMRIRFDYLVTVEDPTIWTRPFTFTLPWRADDPTYRGPDDLFEYACHEGNYRMLENAITAAKAVRAAQAGKK